MNKRRQHSKPSQIDMCWEGQGARFTELSDNIIHRFLSGTILLLSFLLTQPQVLSKVPVGINVEVVPYYEPRRLAEK